MAAEAPSAQPSYFTQSRQSRFLHFVFHSVHQQTKGDAFWLYFHFCSQTYTRRIPSVYSGSHNRGGVWEWECFLCSSLTSPAPSCSLLLPLLLVPPLFVLPPAPMCASPPLTSLPPLPPPSPLIYHIPYPPPFSSPLSPPLPSPLPSPPPSLHFLMSLSFSEDSLLSFL
ncbi:hypothetical protein B484DRAFT_217247 [Ochromonadaceae sp. CCMP2298]|nr:hypothetical protein B484DRAFT_217247 [Ochromonadaceae sp. CCMP2298]